MQKSKCKSQNIGKFLLTNFLLLSFVLTNFVAAQELDLNPKARFEPGSMPLNLNPLEAINSAGIRNRFQFNLPSSWENINITTKVPAAPQIKESQVLPAIDLKQFLTPKNISSKDFGQAIKAIAVLVIEIFLVVISVVSQILKLILGFLK